LLNPFAGRLSRVIDRSRWIEQRFEAMDSAERRPAQWQLRLLDPTAPSA
jgi:hypothetical protein